MEILPYILIGISYFLWPLGHAVWGRNRKTIWLLRIFVVLVVFSVILVVSAVLNIPSAQHKSEMITGTAVFISIASGLSLIASLLVILLVRK